jgi:hypothetical protein
MASLNPMLRAAQKNDCEEAARLARVHPEWAKEKLDDGDTALHIAARHGTLELGQAVVVAPCPLHGIEVSRWPGAPWRTRCSRVSRL